MGEHGEHRGLVRVRTRLDIDDDVLRAVKEIAAARKVTVDFLVSELVREALTLGSPPPARIVMNGLRVVAPTAKAVTGEMVQEPREADI